MLSIIFLSSLFHVSSAIDCLACINDNCYTKSNIFSDKHYYLENPYTVDRRENIVYFQYDSRPEKKYHLIGFNLNDTKITTIPYLEYVTGLTIDEEKKDLYISGIAPTISNKELYKLNLVTNTFDRCTFELLPPADKDEVKQMVFKNKVYYRFNLAKGLYTMNSCDNHNGQVKSIEPISKYKVRDFVVDHNEDLYFVSGETVNLLRKDSSVVEVLINDLYWLSVDKDGLVQFSRDGRVYKLNSEKKQLKLIGAFTEDMLLKIVFDKNNNIVYSKYWYSELGYMTVDKNCTKPDELTKKLNNQVTRDP